MIYLLFHQDHDDCGASIVEGPDNVDLDALRKEHSDGRLKWSKTSTDLVNPFMRPYPYRPSEFTSFEDHFAYWLVKEKGFKIPEHKRYEC